MTAGPPDRRTFPHREGDTGGSAATPQETGREHRPGKDTVPRRTGPPGRPQPARTSTNPHPPGHQHSSRGGDGRRRRRPADRTVLACRPDERPAGETQDVRRTNTPPERTSRPTGTGVDAGVSTGHPVCAAAPNGTPAPEGRRSPPDRTSPPPTPHNPPTPRTHPAGPPRSPSPNTSTVTRTHRPAPAPAAERQGRPEASSRQARAGSRKDRRHGQKRNRHGCTDRGAGGEPVGWREVCRYRTARAASGTVGRVSSRPSAANERPPGRV